MKQITLTRPDDWHCHLRDGDYLTRTVGDISHQFGRAIVMPNLSPPVITVSQAREYRQRILNTIPQGRSFTPLMTLYLTEQSTIEELKKAKTCAWIAGCKLYPAGATTHSAAGITDLTKIYHLLACLEEIDLPLLIHGESINPQIDIFDRETHFIEDELIPLLKHFPALRVVLEHISTQEAVDFVREQPSKLAATITAHHLWANRNDLFQGGVRPHYFCMPILKRRKHQEALIKAATSGNEKFFLGTDSAPHPQFRKESACGCAGIYTAHSAIELYAQLFDQHQALEKLERFASLNGPAFYGLPTNPEKITLVKSPWQIPQQLTFGDTIIIPMLAGETLEWQIYPSGTQL